GAAELAGEVVLVEWVAEDVDVVVGAASFDRVDAEEASVCCLVGAGAEDGDARGGVGEFAVAAEGAEDVPASRVVQGLASRGGLAPRVVGDGTVKAGTGVVHRGCDVAVQVRVGPDVAAGLDRGQYAAGQADELLQDVVGSVEDGDRGVAVGAVGVAHG